MNDKHMVTAENAVKIWGWLQDRGGIAIWQSVNLSNAGASWTTPNEQADGTKTNKPTWQAEDRPSRIITDPAEVMWVLGSQRVAKAHITSAGSVMSISSSTTMTSRVI